MGKNPSDKKGKLMNPSAIKLNVGNPRSRSVYAKGKVTRKYILKR